MKLKKYTILMIGMMLGFTLVQPVNGQLDKLSFVYGPGGDARILLQEYLSPYTDILGSNLNAGWFNTARTHKIGGLDITAMIGVAFAPTDALQYDLSTVLGLSEPFLDPTYAPTALGTMIDRPEIVNTSDVLNDQDILETRQLISYTHPDGYGRDFVAMPMAQISLGLLFGTDITARYVPSIDIGLGAETGLWGIGGKHSISQWIPIVKKLKFIDFSVQGGYTKVTSSVHQELPPISALDPSPDLHWNDQFLVMTASGWTVNFVASQTLALITIYEAVGYASSAAVVDLTGEYPINQVVSDPQSENFGSTTYTIMEDPIQDLLFEGHSGLRINGGLRVKLGVFTLHYDFCMTQHITHTGGIGITFR